MSKPELTWEIVDGETYGYHEPTGAELHITGRIPRSGWTMGTNERTWTVFDADNKQIASATADGLRDAKTAALTALAEYLAAREQAGGSPNPT